MPNNEYWIDSAVGQAMLARGLKALFITQEIVAPRVDPGIETRPIEETTRSYILAMCHELHELMDELGWKMWKQSEPLDPERVAEEFADVLAFMGIIQRILYVRAGLTSEDLARAFRKKTLVNIGRAKQYHGVDEPLEV